VEGARQIQRQRLASYGLHTNSQMQARHLKRFCQLDGEGEKLLEMVVDRLGMSARSYSRILKVARTIADLSGEEKIRQPHLSEAVQYRGLDRKLGVSHCPDTNGGVPRSNARREIVSGQRERRIDVFEIPDFQFIRKTHSLSRIG